MIPYLGPECVDALFGLAACDEAAEAPVLTEQRGKMSQQSSPTFASGMSSTISRFGALLLRAIVGIGFLVHGRSKLSKGPDER
jgi:hypothetical protein